MKAIRIVLSHDWPLLRKGVRAVLENRDDCDVVGEASSAGETVSLIESLSPDVLILNINLPGDDLFSTLTPIKRLSAGTRVLGFMTTTDTARIHEAAEFGVAGFISHTTTAEKLCEAVATVNAGRFFIGSTVARELMAIVAAVPQTALQHTDERYRSLSERECEVFRLIAQGKSNKEIAYILGISPKTVETHHLHIVRKLGVADAVSLIRYAVRIGVITLD